MLFLFLFKPFPPYIPDTMTATTTSKRELEKKVKRPGKIFEIHSISRMGLFYLLGNDEKALDAVNSLSDLEIEKAIESIEVDHEYFYDELAEKIKKILDAKNIEI